MIEEEKMVQKEKSADKENFRKIVPLLWLESGIKNPVHAGSVIIVCGRPGLRRVGVEHEQVRIWPKSHFSREQLMQINQDPQFTIIEVP